MATVKGFQGKWTKLGNYSWCTVFYGGHAYGTVEHGYQAQKSLDPGVQKMIRDAPTPAVAKRIARSVKLRDDWEEVKEQIMLDLLRQKFAQEPERSLLLSTKNDIIEETNWWHDQYWGNCICEKHVQDPGQNRLGHLLRVVRYELGTERNFEMVAQMTFDKFEL